MGSSSSRAGDSSPAMIDAHSLEVKTFVDSSVKPEKWQALLPFAHNGVPIWLSESETKEVLSTEAAKQVRCILQVDMQQRTLQFVPVDNDNSSSTGCGKLCGSAPATASRAFYFLNYSLPGKQVRRRRLTTLPPGLRIARLDLTWADLNEWESMLNASEALLLKSLTPIVDATNLMPAVQQQYSSTVTPRGPLYSSLRPSYSTPEGDS